MPRLTLKEFAPRDIPSKCARCRQWMRRSPTGREKRRYQERAPIPGAAFCFDCHRVNLTHCPFCQSKDIIKFGKKRNKQVLKCKSCGKGFTDNDAAPGMRYSIYVVALAVEMHAQGTTFRAIQTYLADRFGCRPSTQTLSQWAYGRVGALRSEKPHFATFSP